MNLNLTFLLYENYLTNNSIYDHIKCDNATKNVWSQFDLIINLWSWFVFVTTIMSHLV